MRTLALAACLAWPGASAAQSLLDDYGRVITVLNYASVYVGETLLACAAKGGVTDAEAEARFKAYQVRNAAVIDRAEAWKKRADERLSQLGEQSAGRERAQEAGFTAIASASTHARNEVGDASDPRALCASRLSAIDAGTYDLSRNPAFVNLLKD